MSSLERAKKQLDRIKKKEHYDEEKHCLLLLQIMGDKDRATRNCFCLDIGITERTFQNWVNAHPLFGECYDFGKMLSRELWEDEGREIKDFTAPMGMVNHRFEYWRMMGWSRFGISKNGRLKLDLDPKASPSEHYSQLLEQARKGDFTAGEIKQLMEAVNVGLSTHQAITLQKEIDELKADLITMSTNSNVQNTFATPRSTKED